MPQWKAGRSKSLPGTPLIPLALAKEFGADALLSYLLRHIPSTGDADFSRGCCPQAYESELARAPRKTFSFTSAG